jgi:hypothetical protein
MGAPLTERMVPELPFVHAFLLIAGLHGFFEWQILQ